ncbi:ABC transporter ATP-binding protein [Pilimelia anulata]|uniref:ABC transporter ATP-binding protein n=1 Tax=Pilimelia anulata TaxID=53371 RepID=A0A8J3BFD5_9ACTN|nr:ATP-binding cassette domain-containing protein [Pilimelia anulata]GGK06677.1 ABC transporter ATP-binding protein [Pilimelia anulata]
MDITDSPAAPRTPPAAVVEPSEPRPVRLRAAGIHKRFGKRHVLRDVDLTVRSGEVAAIIGANGCGKSTMLKICAGLLSPTTGTVTINGKLSYCPQQAGLMGFLTPDEHFVFFGAGRGLGRGRARADGRELATHLAWNAAPPIQARHLSGGTQQKLNLVLAALGEPDILLLDEPYQGFDRGSYVDFWEWVLRKRDAGTAVVVITHMLNSLDQVDTVLDLTPKADCNS